MASDYIVIKVKFGETLRRFNANVLDGELDLDVPRLRKKIRGLFNFGPDADYTLTYVDEDGDVVTLVDEDDLFDVMRQSLNPLRITVSLTSGKADRSYARASGNSSPMKARRDPQPLNSKVNVSDVLKKVHKSPPKVRHNASKWTRDFTGKTASSVTGNAMGELDVKDQKGSKADISAAVNFPATSSGARVENTSKSNSAGFRNVTGVHTSDQSAYWSVSNKVNHVPFVNMEVKGSVPLPKPVGQSFAEERDAQRTTHPTPVETNSTGQSNQSGVQPTWNRFVSPRPSTVGNGSTVQLPSTYNSVFYGGYNSPYGVLPNHSGLLPSVNYPSVPNYSAMSNYPAACWYPYVPSNYAYGSTNQNGGDIVHRGVQCDGCNIFPIVGLRFKSKVKDDYDLCGTCFAKMGNEADYIKIEKPLVPSNLNSSTEIYNTWTRAGKSPTLGGSGGPKLDSSFIRHVNVLDGTVVAPLAPFTKIWRMRNNGSIIWPHGTQLHWIGGLMLRSSPSVRVEIPGDGLHVGEELDIAVDFTAPELRGEYISHWTMASPTGQKFGQCFWVLIKVDAPLNDSDGSSIQQIDLNIPLVSDGVAGSEIVDVDMKQLPNGVSSDISCPVNKINDGQPLAPPPSSPSFFVPSISTVELPKENAIKSAAPTYAEVVKALAAAQGASENNDGDFGKVQRENLEQPFKDIEVGQTSVYAEVVDNDEELGEEVASPDSEQQVAEIPDVGQEGSVIEDLREQIVRINLEGPVELVQEEVQTPSFDQVFNEDREETLLRELEAMGFPKADLNEEILRMNEYDMEKTLDCLFNVSDWDPIVEELQEMGIN